MQCTMKYVPICFFKVLILRKNLIIKVSFCVFNWFWIKLLFFEEIINESFSLFIYLCHFLTTFTQAMSNSSCDMVLSRVMMWICVTVLASLIGFSWYIFSQFFIHSSLIEGRKKNVLIQISLDGKCPSTPHGWEKLYIDCETWLVFSEYIWSVLVVQYWYETINIYLGYK